LGVIVKKGLNPPGARHSCEGRPERHNWGKGAYGGVVGAYDPGGESRVETGFETSPTKVVFANEAESRQESPNFKGERRKKRAEKKSGTSGGIKASCGPKE